MSWGKRVRKASDAVKPGEMVEVVILGINAPERRISVGLKQALGDPWKEAAQRFPPGSLVEGPIVSLTKFGAFVQLADGIEGMIHVSDISAERRINHPQDVLKVGQSVKAQVLEVDSEKRRLKLGIKQMAPTSIDEYLDEHKPGDVVSGRVVEVQNSVAIAELGEGVRAKCALATGVNAARAAISNVATDLQSLSSMLEARWKSGAVRETSKPTDLQPGQVRSFRIRTIDRTTKNIEVELA
jgi:small subunit ribosomal protein S1